MVLCRMKNTGEFDPRLISMQGKAQLDERLRFFEACEMQRGQARRGGIGTLREKTLHAVLKRYIEPDVSKHEIPVAGHIADVLNDDGIFEIQTRNFDKLRGKLTHVLNDTDLHITVVHPIPATKKLIWIDQNSGEMSKPRKSPKCGAFFDAFKELYKLSELVCTERVSVLLLLVDVDEYRLLDGWSMDKKKGSSRFERIPVALVDSILLENRSDYISLLPADLPEQLTSRCLAETAKLLIGTAQTVLTVLSRVGAVKCVGKNGRLKLYSIIEKAAE